MSCRGSLGMVAGIGIGIGIGLGMRVFDAIMGPHTIQVKTVGSAAPASMASSDDPCSIHSKALEDCVRNSGSDHSKCRQLRDMVSDCRKNSGTLAA